MSAQQSLASMEAVVDREKIYTRIEELCNTGTRENALLQLFMVREVVPDLALLLWHSFGSIAALLQEISNIYVTMIPPTLTEQQSNRVCHALGLLQCVALHPETRSAFLQANIFFCLYPFLQTSLRTLPFEQLLLSSLGVISALVKTNEQEVITILLTTEIIQKCFLIMGTGSELAKTAAIFIFQKILLDDNGLSYICKTHDRFSEASIVLRNMVLSLAKKPSAKLLKYVVGCYIRLCDNPKAKAALRLYLPDQLRDATFTMCLQDNIDTKHLLDQLINVMLPAVPPNPTNPP